MKKKIAILGSTGSIGNTLINIIKQDIKCCIKCNCIFVKESLRKLGEASQ